MREWPFERMAERIVALLARLYRGSATQELRKNVVVRAADPLFAIGTSPRHRRYLNLSCPMRRDFRRRRVTYTANPGTGRTFPISRVEFDDKATLSCCCFRPAGDAAAERRVALTQYTCSLIDDAYGRTFKVCLGLPRRPQDISELNHRRGQRCESRY